MFVQIFMVSRCQILAGFVSNSFPREDAFAPTYGPSAGVLRQELAPSGVILAGNTFTKGEN